MSVSEDVRVAAHRAAWLPAALPFTPEHRPAAASDATSSFDAHKLRRAQSLWPYDPSRDLVITTADGEAAACCTIWFDETTGAAEIEPLGVVPEHRRRGLAIALCHAALDAVARGEATRWSSTPVVTSRIRPHAPRTPPRASRG